MNTQISFKEMAERGKEILASQGPITYEKAKEQVERLKKGSYVCEMDRRTRIYTGVGGMDLFEEAMENQFGVGRLYMGKKVPRLIRKIKGIRIKKSLSGKMYRRIKIVP